MAIAQIVPATLVTENPTYLASVAAIPAWFLPATIGFALAAWIIDPWTSVSRLRQIWHSLTDKFVVKHFSAGSFIGPDGEPTPDSDIAVRLRIRFVRSFANAKLVLRVFACTGTGKKPFEHVIKLQSLDVIAGQILDIPIVDLGIPTEGWDHNRRRGWGPDKQESLIRSSRNMVVLECKGRILTQRHRFFIHPVSHVGRHNEARIYIQDEDDNVFDTSADAKSGTWLYD